MTDVKVQQRGVWVAEADIDYGHDRRQTVVIFEMDGHRLIARGDALLPPGVRGPAWRTEPVEAMNQH